MKTQLQTVGVVVIALLCGVSQALPQQTGQDSLEACVQTCIDSIIQPGACDDSSNQASCVCGVCKPDPTSSSCIPTLQSCVQSSCPPSFADPTAEYCGTGPFSSSSTSENLYTIQTDTTAWMTRRSTTFTTTARSTPTTGTFNPSSVESPRITASATTSGTGTVVSPATATAAPVSSPSSSGNAAASNADLGSPWKGLLTAGLGMMMTIVIV